MVVKPPLVEYFMKGQRVVFFVFVFLGYHAFADSNEILFVAKSPIENPQIN